MLNENYMIYDLYGAYNCPNDKVIYIFYELITKVVFLIFFILIQMALYFFLRKNLIAKLTK